MYCCSRQHIDVVQLDPKVAFFLLTVVKYDVVRMPDGCGTASPSIPDKTNRKEGQECLLTEGLLS
jgi:hypothetical protein